MTVDVDGNRAAHLAGGAFTRSIIEYTQRQQMSLVRNSPPWNRPLIMATPMI